jgi:transketolase
MASFAFRKKCVDTIRVLCADMVEKAKSGHPGAAVSCAPMAYVLFSQMMKFNPEKPDWINRDRFVLSNGHVCVLLYSMLHLHGYAVSMDDLKQFRQHNSRTPGHPENFMTAGVETCTGPLGQGLTNAVGMAIGTRQMAATYNKPGFNIFNNFTYVICGDGCLQEGITSEASSLAGHLGLGNLVVLYDDNLITIDGSTSLSFTEDVVKRYEAYGWHTITLADGNDVDAIQQAVEAAKAVTDKPSLIKIRTIIGEGCSKQGKASCHGAPLGPSDLSMLKRTYGFSEKDSFVVDKDVYDFFGTQTSKAQAAEAQWHALLDKYSRQHPQEADELQRRFRGEAPDMGQVFQNGMEPCLEAKATRQHSEFVLNKIAAALPEVVGGSADLSPSNLTVLKCSGDFQKDTPAGRYIRFGVREHAMAGVCNGLAAFGGYRPYCATFLNFVGYALGSVRLSALCRFPVLYVATHDTIGLGEDGPTHQPVEMLETLRATPNLLTLRPADGNEVAGAYAVAMQETTRPSVMALSRQKCEPVTGTDVKKVALGAYLVQDLGDKSSASVPSLIVVATGWELGLARAVAAKVSAEDGCRVQLVSMPCQELYDEQPQAYKEGLFPEGAPVLSVECSSTRGWAAYSHAQWGIDSFGKSAPASALFSDYGFTEENLLKCARELIAFYKGKQAPSLAKRLTFNCHTPVSGHH